MIDTQTESGINPYGFRKDKISDSQDVRYAIAIWPIDVTTGCIVDSVRTVSGFRIERKTTGGLPMWTIKGNGIHDSSTDSFDIVDAVRRGEEDAND